jgi:hypothetical protein
MIQRNLAKDEIIILILGTVRSEKQDFFSTLHAFSLLMVKGRDGSTILNIPAWPVLVALAAFFVTRAIRLRQS